MGKNLYNTPISNRYAPVSDVIDKTKSIYSNFSQPLFLILTFDI